MLALVAAALGGYALGGYAGAPPPNFVILFADNMGWANVGFHRPPERDPREFATPNVMGLVEEGIILERHYTYKFCSPSRSSLLSGRLPFHVNIYNDDPAMPGAGIPEKMTTLPERLHGAGYKTHFVGKWHVGMASPRVTPEGRGFESSLGYFHSTNDYYSSVRQEGCDGLPAVDLWDSGKPAYELNGTAYEERIFAARAVAVVEAHPVEQPFFLYYAFHTSCVGWAYNGDDHSGAEKLQPDHEYYKRFAFVDDPDRRANNAMVSLMDDAVGNITSALRRKGMWENTLLLWSSDNGGAVHLGGGANTWPLRGGYYNNWEG
eukprot:Hpha_TRINITY_DN25904_c0_g1::TRINITY_DN25904_c0_g1_i1::g.185262::m.185262/K01135/ARSB; arylsulfatase B